MTLPGLSQDDLIHAPWTDPAFGYVIALIVALLSIAVSLGTIALILGGAVVAVIHRRWRLLLTVVVGAATIGFGAWVGRERAI